jgi:hypothetical protein
MKCEWQHAKAGRFPHKVPGTENAKDAPVRAKMHAGYKKP